MKPFSTFTLFASALILLGAGCAGGANQNADVTANTTSTPGAAEKIVFSPPESLEATEGAAYSYSFCKPDSARSETACGGPTGATQNPILGNPPYTFSHPIEAASLPPGLSINPNGLLEGTPTLAGKFPFAVCAKDGKDVTCATTTLTVKSKTTLPPPPPPPAPKKSLETSTSGTGKGTITTIPTNANLMFDASVRVTLTAVPAAGSTFDRWEGDCDGSGSCVLEMASNRSVTAVFNLVPVVPKVSADLKVNSLSCAWTVKTGDYGIKSDCVRITSGGTAQGPVGTRVELPILSWSDDKFDCGAWTLKAGALVTVGSTCVRKDGQPETTSWTADTGGEECPTKSYWNNNRSYTAKVYLNGDLQPQKTDNKTTVCQ